MDQLDKLAGTWKGDNSTSKGFDELMTVLGFPPDKKETEQMKEEKTIMTHRKKENGYWETEMTIGEYKDTVTWKIGEEYETKTILGGTTRATPKFEGNTIVEVQKIITDGKEYELFVRTIINDNDMVSEMECNGVKCTSVLVRQK